MGGTNYKPTDMTKGPVVAIVVDPDSENEIGKGGSLDWCPECSDYVP